METKTAQEIAAEIGAPTQDLLGTQDWQSDLHTDQLVSELHYANDGGCIPFRITNTRTGEVFSKIPSENAPGDVDSIYNDMITNHQSVAFDILPALYAAIPDLDPESPIVRGLNVGGKEMIADLVDGQIQNVREVAGSPIFTVDKSGVLQTDLSNLSDAHQALAQPALAQATSAILAKSPGVASVAKG